MTEDLKYSDNLIKIYSKTNQYLTNLAPNSTTLILTKIPYNLNHNDIDIFLTECWRVLIESGKLVLFIHDLITDIPYWTEALEKHNLSTRQLWYWDKSFIRNPVNQKGGSNLYNDIELILYATKGRSLLKNLCRSNLFSYKEVNKQDKIHNLQLPIALCKEIIDIMCPNRRQSLVVDPFTNGGSVLLAAKELEISSIGYIQPNEVDKIQNRFNQFVFPI